MLKIAWALEYMAAFIGLAIGAAIVFATISKEFTTEALIAASVGALPLVMVAAAELCKIPMVRSIMNAKRWWGSMIAAILLIGACGLTFETVFNGLERQWAVRSLQIDRAKAEVANIHEKIIQKGNAVIDLNEPRLAQIEELRQERSVAEDRIKELDKKLASEIEGHNRRYQICVENKRPGCVSGGKFVAGYKADHAKAVKPLLARIEQLNNEIDRLNRQTKSSVKADERREEIANLREALPTKKARLNELILNSQIHRLAAKVYGKDNPQEVTQEQVTFVALLWFISVAAFVAFMGPGLAFNYEITGDHWKRPEKSQDKTLQASVARAKEKFYRARRKYLARRRKKLVRTEIRYLDRIIYKYVAVPEDYTAEQIKAEVVKLHAVS